MQARADSFVISQLVKHYEVIILKRFILKYEFEIYIGYVFKYQLSRMTITNFPTEA